MGAYRVWKGALKNKRLHKNKWFLNIQGVPKKSLQQTIIIITIIIMIIVIIKISIRVFSCA